ncbi:MAG TPA: hypothetical protein VFS58_08310 [Steroidobacteraceae bacterium]|nr:hypothetical protein [Steroidobacteraceae bacterium]
MRNRLFAIFTTGPFVLALATLLINDGLLKEAYPGLITGKLSDFAGIAMVALPLFAAFPRHARTIYLAVFGAFLWWKSPASGGFIAFMNDAQPLNFGRTVDYWDLVALAILPACANFATSEPRGIVNADRFRRWMLPPVLVATLFGVMATSQVHYRKDFVVRAVESSAPFPRDSIVDSIKEISKSRGLKPREPNPPHWEGAFAGRGIFLTYSFIEPNQVAVGIQINPGMFGDGEVRRAEKLRAEIKKTLALRFKGLESIEPLRER